MIWKLIFNIAKFTKECKEDKISAYAAQSAFFILLAIIPFLMVFLSLLRYTPVTESMLLELYEKALPGYISPFFISITDEIYSRSIGVTAVSSIVALWSAAKGMHALANGLNAVNDLEETRNWFVLRFWAAIYTVIFMIVLVFTMLVGVFGNAIRTLAINYLPILRELSVVLSSFKGILLFAILAVFFDVVFTVLPNTKNDFISHLPGAVLCAVAWYAISFALSIYINYFNGFSMYGSLTTVALMMLWLYFCIYSTLMCAEFNVTFGENMKRWINRYKKI